LEQTYVSPKPKKRDGVRAKTSVAFKQRWHTDLQSEHAEMARVAEEKANAEMARLLEEREKEKSPKKKK
jgi:Uri superfamily endonuclease